MGSANRGGLGNAPGHSAVATAAASLVNLAAWSASSPRSGSQSGFAWPDCQARIAHAGGAARTAVRGRTGGARAWSGSCVPVSHCAQRGPLRSVPFPQRCRPRPCGDSTAGDSSRRTRALTRADAARFAGFGEGIAEASRSSANRPRGACCGCVSTAMRPLFRSHCGATFEAAGAQRCSVDRAAGIRSQRALETGAGRLLWQAPAHDLLDSIRGACSRDRLDELIGGDQCLHSAEHAAIRCKQQQLGGAGLMLPHELLRLRAADIGDQKVH